MSTTDGAVIWYSHTVWLVPAYRWTGLRTEIVGYTGIWWMQ